MGTAVKWGVILAVTVTVFNLIWVLAGLHTSPVAVMGYLAVVTILAILAVVLALKATASENPYGRQLLSSLVLGVVGGAVIFLTSWIMLSFVFPDTIPEQIAGFTSYYETLPLSDERVQQMISSLEGVTALGSAFQGATGTVITSLVIGAIAGAFLRKKQAVSG